MVQECIHFLLLIYTELRSPRYCHFWELYTEFNRNKKAMLKQICCSSSNSSLVEIFKALKYCESLKTELLHLLVCKITPDIHESQ